MHIKVKVFDGYSSQNDHLTASAISKRDIVPKKRKWFCDINCCFLSHFSCVEWYSCRKRLFLNYVIEWTYTLSNIILGDKSGYK